MLNTVPQRVRGAHMDTFDSILTWCVETLVHLRGQYTVRIGLVHLEKCGL